MAPSAKQKPNEVKAHKMPEQSVFFDRLVPIVMILLAVIMVGLIVFSLGVLTGLIRWY